MNNIADGHDRRMLVILRDIILVAGVYLSLGAMGISFAIAPGYASPIFPAAGFAVAIMLRSSKRVWPGIWIGSFALNLGIAWLRGDLQLSSGMIAFGIACGSTAQAFLAWWLLTRNLIHGSAMETERDIFNCLALAGPLACLTSATLGVAVLYWAHVVPLRELPFAWLSWWSGDMLGVVVVLPISLALLYRNEMPWSSRITTLVLPMMLALGVVGVAFYAVAQWERSEQKLLIQTHGEALANRLQQRFIAHQEVLSALNRLIEVTPDMSSYQFEYFTGISLRENHDIFALSFNPYVLREQREAFERDLTHKYGATGLEIKERDSQSRLVRAADRPDYVVVGHIAPLEGNRAAIGYDINSEPIRHATIQRTMVSNQPAVTAPVKLVQEHQQRVGVLLLQASHTEATSNVAANGNNSPVGFAVAVIKVDEMVEIATRSVIIQGLIFQVDDAQAPVEHSAVYRSETLSGSHDDYYAWQTQLAIADRLWTLKVAPTDEFLRQKPHWTALIVGTGGLMLATLLQMLLLITTGRSAIFQSKVREQTIELQAKTDIMEDRNEQLSVVFALSPDGFIAFDREQRVKYSSPAFTDLLGLTEDRVIGLDEAALSELLVGLCIPTAHFCGVATLRRELDAESDGVNPRRELIELSGPHHRILQVGLRLSIAEAGTVSQILYFRDITYESEIDRMKSEFLTTAAHELRTPMASIYGFSELLLVQDHDPETAQELVSIIFRQSEHMANLINELLDLARIEARQGKDFVFETFAIEKLIAYELSVHKVPEGRAVPAVMPFVVPLYVYADFSKIQQALSNLLSNAYKYSPGGGEVSIRILKVEDGGKARAGIEVCDHGIGMTPEQQARACERFYRADSSGNILGSGLGLSIVKEIVELQGGELTIESKLGAGTTVTLWLPLVNPTPEVIEE